MTSTINVKREAINDLVKLRDEFDAVIDSLELMADKDFMESYKKSKEQVKKRDFADWNEL